MPPPGHLSSVIVRFRDGTAEIHDRTNGHNALASCASYTDALWQQLRLELGDEKHASLLRFAARLPALSSRILRAGQIYACEHVGPPDWHDPNVYRVHSQTDSARRYLVTCPPDAPATWSCRVLISNLPPGTPDWTCPDIAHNAPRTPAGHQRCKHMIAASLHRQWDWQPWHDSQRACALTGQKPAPIATPEAPIARYADGSPVDPDLLVDFAQFVRNHRRLPLNVTALR